MRPLALLFLVACANSDGDTTEPPVAAPDWDIPEEVFYSDGAGAWRLNLQTGATTELSTRTMVDLALSPDRNRVATFDLATVDVAAADGSGPLLEGAFVDGLMGFPDSDYVLAHDGLSLFRLDLNGMAQAIWPGFMNLGERVDGGATRGGRCLFAAEDAQGESWLMSVDPDDPDDLIQMPLGPGDPSCASLFFNADGSVVCRVGESVLVTDRKLKSADRVTLERSPRKVWPGPGGTLLGLISSSPDKNDPLCAEKRFGETCVVSADLHTGLLTRIDGWTALGSRFEPGRILVSRDGQAMLAAVGEELYLGGTDGQFIDSVHAVDVQFGALAW